MRIKSSVGAGLKVLSLVFVTTMLASCKQGFTPDEARKYLEGLEFGGYYFREFAPKISSSPFLGDKAAAERINREVAKQILDILLDTSVNYRDIERDFRVRTSKEYRDNTGMMLAPNTPYGPTTAALEALLESGVSSDVLLVWPPTGDPSDTLFLVPEAAQGNVINTVVSGTNISYVVTIKSYELGEIIGINVEGNQAEVLFSVVAKQAPRMREFDLALDKLGYQSSMIGGFYEGKGLGLGEHRVRLTRIGETWVFE